MPMASEDLSHLEFVGFISFSLGLASIIGGLLLGPKADTGWNCESPPSNQHRRWEQGDKGLANASPRDQAGSPSTCCRGA